MFGKFRWCSDISFDRWGHKYGCALSHADLGYGRIVPTFQIAPGPPLQTKLRADNFSFRYMT